MSLPSLYPHQVDFVSRVRTSIAKHRRVIACGRTGFGKSRVAKWIASKSASNGKQVLTAVHRRGLVDNLSQAFTESPEVRHGIIMSQSETRGGLPIQIASIDTMLSWYCEGEYDGPHFDLVIYDECHSHLSKLAKFLQSHDAVTAEPAFCLGLSATPEAQGLAEVFNDIVTGPTATWLEDEGYAAPFRYLAGSKGRLDQLEKRGLRFTDESQNRAFESLQGDFIRDWCVHAYGRPTVGFFPRLSHAEEAQRVLLREGINAGYVDGKTPDNERRRLFDQLGAGEIDYLANVGVVERGTNIPQIACIQLCLGIGDRKRMLQMLGRGSRTAEGKEDCLVLDHADNLRRHGLYTDEVAWTLDQSEKAVKDQAVRDTIECPSCGAVYRGGKCRRCDYEPTVGERKAQGLQFDGSELKPYEKPKAKPEPTHPAKILVGCLYAAARSGRTYRQACGMAKKEAEQRGQVMQWPRSLDVGDRTIETLRYGDPMQNRKVSELFPWMTN